VRSGSKRCIGAIGLVALGLLASAASPCDAVSTANPAQRLKACVISLNDPDEVQAFRAHLDPKQFDVIDVRALAATRGGRPDAPGAGSASWLLNACHVEATCDIMIYSAEFAGQFFGKQGASLGLQEMEEASCQTRCAGLFQRPREVFLLACNTLASKDEDSRTPEQYLQVLLDHGFDRAAAERVVELRYGPLGPSFRESLRRIFAGVPRIYGFSSVAPKGQYTAPMLERYLRGRKDYAQTLVAATHSMTKNAALFASFKGTSLTQTAGLSPAESGAVDRAHICALYDDSRSVADRLRIAYGFMERPDALTFVPTVEVFLTRHPPESLSLVERSTLAEIENLDAAREAVMQLVRRLNISALKLEMAQLAVLVGWLDRSEFHALAVDGARALLHQRLSSEVVDIMCEITKREPLHDAFVADSFPTLLYDDPDGLRLIACLAPSDPRVAPRVMPGLQSADAVKRVWAAYTLTRLLPRDAALLEQLVPYLHDASAEVANRVRWVFLAQPELPRTVERRIRDVDPTLLREWSEARDRARRQQHTERHDADAADPMRIVDADTR
jgi:hypothetical protein